MAGFPSDAGSNPFTLDETFKRVRAVSGRIKTMSAQLKAQSLAGPITTTSVVRYCEGLAALKAQLAALVNSEPRLAAYAQQQYPDLDLVASYAAMVAQIDITITAIVNGFPKAAGTGEILEGTINAAGVFVPTTFATASPIAVGLRTRIDALIDPAIIN